MKARLAKNDLCLAPSAVFRHDRCPDRAPVGLGPYQLDLQPVRLPGNVVPEQRGRFVEVDDEDVDIAVVVEIAEGAAPAALAVVNCSPGLAKQLLEPSVPEVAEQDARRCRRVALEFTSELGDTRCR